MKSIPRRPSGDAIWEGVDRLIDRAPTLADLRSHRIELLAARRWRALGRAVPDEFVELERRSALHRLVVPRLLERVRGAYDGPMIVHKGPEVAAHYPDPILRDFGDVDLIVPNAEEVQRALIAAGFEEIGDPALYLDIHHLRPLRWPELPLHVEIHARPKWVDSLAAPPVEELFAVAVPSTTIDGVEAFPPEHHALLLAVHSWAHEPLRRLRDVIDIAAVAAGADRRRSNDSPRDGVSRASGGPRAMSSQLSLPKARGRCPPGLGAQPGARARAHRAREPPSALVERFLDPGVGRAASTFRQPSGASCRKATKLEREAGPVKAGARERVPAPLGTRRRARAKKVAAFSLAG